MDKRIEEKLQKEGIVKNEPAVWVDSASTMQSGRLLLTSKYLYFILNDAGRPAITIDLDTINAIACETLLTDHNVMAVHYLQYDVSRFSVLDYASWEHEIEARRMKPHIGKTNSSTIQGPRT